MDFDLSPEQRILGDSVSRLLADHAGFEARRAVAASAPGWRRALWGQYAALGLTGLLVPPEHGGYGGGGADAMIVMEALGGALALEPFLATAVLATAALRANSGTDHAATLLPAIAEGRVVVAWAHAEEGARHELSHVATTARRIGGTWHLDGAKSLVSHGADADHLLVSARVAGRVDDEGGLGLFVVAAGAPGLLARRGRTIDLVPCADLVLTGVAGEPLGAPGEAWPAIRTVTEAGIAAVCAEAVGAMAAAHELTVGYLKTRTQFGRTIGSNQALQHRAADMLVALEQARSMAMLAAMMLDHPDAAERSVNLSRAKLIVGRAARLVGQQAIQLHGGIGVTEEYAVGHYHRRLLVIEQMFGDSAHHLAKLANAG